PAVPCSPGHREIGPVGNWAILRIQSRPWFPRLKEALIQRLPSCQICNIGLKNHVHSRPNRLSRLHGEPAWIRFDSRNAGATAVRVGLAATQGWGERGPSATLAG